MCGHRAAGRGDQWRAEVRALRNDVRALVDSLRHTARAYTPDARQLSAIRDVIGDARRRIEAILAERHARPRAEDGGTPPVM
jgi:hypothetical protein